MKQDKTTMPEFNRDFVVFKNEDEWLEARKKTIGASGLAQFWATGQQPTPLPDNVPALQSALAFGSMGAVYRAEVRGQHGSDHQAGQHRLL